MVVSFSEFKLNLKSKLRPESTKMSRFFDTKFFERIKTSDKHPTRSESLGGAWSLLFRCQCPLHIFGQGFSLSFLKKTNGKDLNWQLAGA